MPLELPDGQAPPTGAFTVVAYIFDAQNFVTDSATLEVDTARLSLDAANAASPLGVVATVTDIGGDPWAGRTIRWTVLRNGVPLYDYEDDTGTDGTVAVLGDELGVPAGPLTVRAQLVGLVRRSSSRPRASTCTSTG